LAIAKAVKDEAFKNALEQYQKLTPSERQVSFIDWSREHDNGYLKAWEAEDVLEKRYESLQEDALDDVSRALATMKSADSRFDYKYQ
jgi:hypothetical protein